MESGLAKCTTESPSPFETLNRELSEKNARLDELVTRMERKLHKLSDTNIPTEPSNNKEGLPELPFREGHLMEYYYKLNNYSTHINRLLIQVEKLEGFI